MAHTDLTPLTAEEQKQLRDALKDTNQPAGAGLGGIDVGGTKDAFCDSWPTIKEFLNAIKGLPLIPHRIRDAIPQVLQWGDSIFGTVCKAH